MQGKGDLFMEQATHVAADVATYGGATSSIVFWGLKISEIGVIVSTIVAVCGLVLQVYFKLRSDKRAEETHRLIMEKALSDKEITDAKSSEETS